MVVAGALVVTPDRPEFPECNRTEFSEPAEGYRSMGKGEGRFQGARKRAGS